MRNASFLILGALVALAGCTVDTPGSSGEGLFIEKTCMAHTTAIECEGEIGSNLAVSNDATTLHMINDAETDFRIAAENIYVGTAPAPTLADGTLDTDAFPFKHDYGAGGGYGAGGTGAGAGGGYGTGAGGGYGTGGTGAGYGTGSGGLGNADYDDPYR